MTAYLHFEVAQPAMRYPSSHRVVVTVRQIADENDKYPEAPFETAVVTGTSIAANGVKVPPGRYRLEARLPSGRVLRENRVLSQDSREFVRFDAGGSFHEWLGWQTIAGNAPPPDLYEARRKDLVARDVREGVESFAPAFGFLVVTSTPEGPTVDQPFAHDFESHFDEIVSLWSARFPDVSHEWTVQEDTGAPAERVVALLRTAGATLLAFLPVPWLTRLHEPAEIQCVHDRSIPNERGLRVSVVDSERSALLSYLGASRMLEATAAFDAAGFGEQVLREMQEKRENPLAAAAAAYVGLSYPIRDDRRERWSPWLKNLMNRFPGIPDGAILRARDLIERAATEEDLAMALKALAVAFRRGPPYFSAGVRHLLEGLSLFASSAERYGLPSEEVRNMHAVVSGFAVLVDPTQTFTVLKLAPDFFRV